MLKQVANRIPRQEKVLIELYMHPIFRHDAAYFWAVGGGESAKLFPDRNACKDILRNQPFALHVMPLKNYLTDRELQNLMPLLNKHYTQEGPLLIRKTNWPATSDP